jgi:hypothetical protein
MAGKTASRSAKRRPLKAILARPRSPAERRVAKDRAALKERIRRTLGAPGGVAWDLREMEALLLRVRRVTSDKIPDERVLLPYLIDDPWHLKHAQTFATLVIARRPPDWAKQRVLERKSVRAVWNHVLRQFFVRYGLKPHQEGELLRRLIGDLATIDGTPLNKFLGPATAILANDSLASDLLDGRKPGRPSSLDPELLERVERLIADDGMTEREACRQVAGIDEALADRLRKAHQRRRQH